MTPFTRPDFHTSCPAHVLTFTRPGRADYTTAIDTWSYGCVFAELILGQPLFPGESNVDQLVEIIKVYSQFAT